MLISGPRSSLACSIIVKCRDKKGVFFYNLTGFVVLSSTGSLVYHTHTPQRRTRTVLGEDHISLAWTIDSFALNGQLIDLNSAQRDFFHGLNSKTIIATLQSNEQLFAAVRLDGRMLLLLSCIIRCCGYLTLRWNSCPTYRTQ